jgi:Phosphodiester glycosidase
MGGRAKTYLSSRGRTLALCAAFAAAVGLSRVAPPGNELGQLTAALGEATHQSVEVEGLAWEPSGGVLADALVGRFVLFLGSDKKGGPRDVWRARVRVSPEGHPLAIDDVHDLTGTPLGDDHGLVLRGEHAVFATHAFGQEQSVTLLDLSSEGAQNTATLDTDRAMAWLTNLQTTGAGAGVARVDVTLDEPARTVALALDDAAVTIDLTDDGGRKRRARLDLAKGELDAAAVGLHADASRHLPKRFVFWAVDTVRAVPWIGPAPIAWLEDKTFALRDASRQLSFRLHDADATQTLAAAPGEGAAPPPSVLDTSQTGADAAHWPPPSIRTIWKTPEPGEGEWQTPRLPWMRKVPGASATAPSPFYRTFVRPDEERPYAKVLLVAMDMRQLELGMEAGVEDPKPLAGPHGSGRIPRDPQIATRVVAAFNGAFKTEHGNYGMMVNRRVLLPPQPGAASIVVTRDQRVGLGSWGTTKDVSGLRGIADADIVSFRQNLDALLDNGEINPTKRALWGYTLPGSGTQTERSGVCVTDAGHLAYAWGEDVSATTLAKAMKMAGCVYGMHLDMNPHHTGFLFTTINDLKSRAYKSELLAPKMEISPDRYIEYANKDFFYVMVHDSTPPAIAGVSAWAPDGGAQPAPVWMPGVFTARGDGGVELFDVEPGRATWRIRAGGHEPDAKTGQSPARELPGDDAHKVILAVGLGVSQEKHPRGLATDGRLVLPMSGGATGVLSASADGTLAIVHPAELGPIAPHSDAVELPLLLDDGALVAAPHEAHPAVVRAALGRTEGGRVLFARGGASFASLAETLKRAGCVRAVALDRGGVSEPALHRAGTADPPRAHYEETTLSAIAVPLKPRGFRFEPEAKVAQATPPR